jgi:AraC-like DNA-binding protein
MIAVLTDIVLIITGFLLLLFAAVVLSQRRGRAVSRYLLAGFLFTKALLVIRWSLGRFHVLAFEDHRYFFYSSAALFFLLAPWVYLYVRSVCYKNYRPGMLSLLHGFPFLFVLAYTLGILLTEHQPELPGILSYPSNHYLQLFWGINFLQILAYILAMVRVVNSYHRRIKELYSSISRIKMDWLNGLLLLISLYWVFVVTKGIMTIIQPEATTFARAVDLFSITIFLVFVCILVVRGLAHINIFNGVVANGNLHPKLSEQEARAIYLQVLDFMQQNKPYLLPTLSLDQLGTQVNLPAWQISYAINHVTGQNFFSFINAYRVKEAQRKLEVVGERKLTVLEILYDVGFNSKSTFNNVFKKATGMTPTEYRLKHQM